jgi:alpha-L-arabinofuranosidase
MNSFGSPSYYAQVMIAQNKTDRVLPAEVDVKHKTTVAERRPSGAVGLGAWLTDVEYKDLRVTGPDGKTLLAGNAATDLKQWNFTGGEWTSQDGVLKPANPRESSWGMIGDAKWADYTLSVKARKNGGEEGFLVLWHAADTDNYNWWNIGGWGNTRTQAEVAHDGNREPYGPTSDFRAESGKWYDLRIEVRGGRARCFIDNKLVTDATDRPTPPPAQPLYVGAGYVSGTKEVVVKVVNYSGEPIDTTLNLRGTTNVKPTGKAIVLAGQPRDVNTLAEPKKVAPKEEAINDGSKTMHRTFPRYSFTVLRIPAAAE